MIANQRSGQGMPSTKAERLIRSPDDPSKPTYVELFFDVVFVIVFIRLSETVVENVGWGSLGTTGILLLAFWWVWAYTNLAAETVNANHPRVQLLVIWTMFAVLLMSVAVPEAYERRGLLFAGAYVTIHLSRSIFLAYALRGHRLWRRPIRGIVWFGFSGLWWLAGAFVDDWRRVLLWSIALGIDYTAPFLRWPTPGLSRSPAWEWNLANRYLAERYQQFIIIALGEIILIGGRTFRRGEVSGGSITAFVISFVTAVLLWWVYFHQTRERLATPVSTSPDPRHESKWTGFAHLLMVAGILLTSLRTELTIRHPSGDGTPAIWVAIIVGGPGIFLLGRMLFETEVLGRLSQIWLLGVALLFVTAPLLVLVSPLVVAVITVTILASTIALNRVLDRRPL